ncbi:hypothetical protein ACVMLG_22080, partial [Escherichia coli]
MANHKARPPRARKARFDDRCRLCSLPVNAGDSVAWTADNVVAHLSCATEHAATVEARRQRDASQALKRRARR